MKLRINNYDFTVNEDEETALLNQLVTFLLSKYEKLPTTMQLAAKLFVRSKVLETMERQIAAAYDKEIAKQVRPPKGVDPVIHAAKLFLPRFRQEITDVTLECTIEDGSDSITDIRVATSHKN